MELWRLTRIFRPRAFQEWSMFHTKELLTGRYLELEQEVSGTRRAAEITGRYAILGSQGPICVNVLRMLDFWCRILEIF